MDTVHVRNGSPVSWCLCFLTWNLVTILTELSQTIHYLFTVFEFYFPPFVSLGLSKLEIKIILTGWHFFLPDLPCEEPENANGLYSATGSTVQIVTNETQQMLTSWNAKDGPGIFPCNMCGKVYRYYRNLHTHRRECGQEPRFHCPYCSLRTKTKSNLKRHIRLKHWILPSVTWLYVDGKNCFFRLNKSILRLNVSKKSLPSHIFMFSNNSILHKQIILEGSADCLNYSIACCRMEHYFRRFWNSLNHSGRIIRCMLSI